MRPSHLIAALLVACGAAGPAAARSAWEGFYCAGSRDVAMRVQIVPADGGAFVERSAAKPGATPKETRGVIMSATPDTMTARFPNGKMQAMRLQGDRLTVSEDAASLELSRCEWLGDDDVFYLRRKIQKMGLFGDPDCRPFRSNMAVFAFDPTARTGGLLQTLIGRGKGVVNYCRSLPLSPDRAFQTLRQAMSGAGLTVAAADAAARSIETPAIALDEGGRGRHFAELPFRERFTVRVVPEDGASRAVIAREVFVDAPDRSGWMPLSSDGSKEHWLLTEALRLASIPVAKPPPAPARKRGRPARRP